MIQSDITFIESWLTFDMKVWLDEHATDREWKRVDGELILLLDEEDATAFRLRFGV